MEVEGVGFAGGVATGTARNGLCVSGESVREVALFLSGGGGGGMVGVLEVVWGGYW